jgi:ankyrin repeat protein
MSLLDLPPELLLTIANNIRDESDDGELRYNGFNLFVQVNSTLYNDLNRMLWKEAAQDENRTPLVFTHLIYANNLPHLKFFLELGADVEVRLPVFDITGVHRDYHYYLPRSGKFYPTPLIVAADLNDGALARLLLETNAKVEYSGQLSPLHAARSAEMVQLLLEHKADPDLDEIDSRPPTRYASRDDITAMRAILQHGAKVNGFVRDGYKRGPLHEAAERSLAAVELLVEHGADVKERDSFGQTPLHLAAQDGKIEIVEFLVERWPEGMKERSNDTSIPLHLAALEGKTEVVRFLMEQWSESIRVKGARVYAPFH